MNQEGTAHLEYQEHPGDAETDEGALNEVDHPHQAEFHNCYCKRRKVSKGLDA